ncbi:MAG TPA: hypothetical protein VG204_00265 [Terriglobia bacterium]|nr:hypothetical protein [Terriglobia bacterium]
MAPLTAQVDARDSARIVFSQAVTLKEATSYLWRQPPLQPDAIRPDPVERSLAGRQRCYLINKADLDLVFSLQHGLANEYVKRIKPIMSKGSVELPRWVPPHVRQTILNGSLPNGVHHFPGVKPWGDVVAWINRSGGYVSIEVYEEYPDDIDYYLGITRGDGHQARLLHQVYTGYNRDMRYFVEEKGLSPDSARSEIRRINDELFKLVIEATVMMLNCGTGISAVHNSIRSSYSQVAETAERTGYASTKSQEAVEEIRLSQEEYRAALKQVFPGQYLDAVTRTVDEIGQRAAERVVKNPAFVKAVQNEDWTLAGTLFHSAAKEEARTLPAGALPPGWTLTAEHTIQSGAGGSRADVLLQGPALEAIEFDWKTTGRSALSSGARKEMAKHAGQITVNIGAKLTKQESRSWVDYVRPLLPSLFR